ncbi:MAG: carbon storage regulator [Clostridia bacterium]|nr:carbon storage regulator CsrA [Candidatus Pelethousia sp.]NCB31217.1 carbon storage regulator [Clostridia bacterium]
MLVLTRKLEESLLLGSEIRITVLGVSGDKVRLGIDAPRTVKILRGETVDQTKEANRLAAASGMNLAAIFKDAAQAMETQKKQPEKE